MSERGRGVRRELTGTSLKSEKLKLLDNYLFLFLLFPDLGCDFASQGISHTHVRTPIFLYVHLPPSPHHVYAPILCTLRPSYMHMYMYMCMYMVYMYMYMCMYAYRQIPHSSSACQ